MTLAQDVRPEAIGVRVQNPEKRESSIRARARRIHGLINKTLPMLRDIPGVVVPGGDAGQMVENVLYGVFSECIPFTRAELYGE